MKKLGNCPYCYGLSLLLTLFLLVMLVTGLLIHLPLLIINILLVLFCGFCSWSVLHLGFFIARFNKISRPLFPSPISRMKHLAKLAYTFTISSFLLVIKPKGHAMSKP